MSVVTVFDKLRHDPEDIFHPAREQHGGEGSYGNGSAMRVSPVALLCKSEEELIKVRMWWLIGLVLPHSSTVSLFDHKLTV